MNVLIIPGYGDRFDYLESATKGWPEKYGLEPEIKVFGWSGEPESFDAKWEALSGYIKKQDRIAIIGISAGASVALRALQTHPDKVKKVVTICGPVHKELMNPRTLETKYPILQRSLDQLDLKGLNAKKVMSLYPIYDNVAKIRAMQIKGAHNVRMATLWHPTGIWWAMNVNAGRIAKFINS